MRRRRSVLTAIGLAWLALSAGCTSTPETNARYDPLERFPVEGVWVWDTASNVVPEGPRFEGLELGPVLDEALTETLAARGYREGTGAAHYRVSYQLGIATRVRPEEVVVMGSLSVTLAEVATGRPVWVGFAQAEIDPGRTREQRRQRIREILDELLQDFPPRPE